MQCLPPLVPMDPAQVPYFDLFYLFYAETPVYPFNKSSHPPFTTISHHPPLLSPTTTNIAQTDTKTWLEASNAYFSDNDAISIQRLCSKKSPIDDDTDGSKYVLFKYFMGGDNQAYDSCTDSSAGVVDSPFFEAYPGMSTFL